MFRSVWVLLLLGIMPALLRADVVPSDARHIAELQASVKQALVDRSYQQAAEQVEELSQLTRIQANSRQDSASWDAFADARTVWARIQIYYSHFQSVMDQLPEDIQLVKKGLGRSHPRLGDLWHQLGTAEWKVERYRQSMDHLQEALQIIEGQTELDSVRISRSYNSIGYVYSRLGKAELGLEYHRKTLAIRQGMYGAEHDLIAQSYNNMGLIYKGQGEFEQALQMQEAALRIRKASLGEHHPKVGASYNNLGGIYQQQGDFALGAEQYERALRVWREAFSGDHMYLVGIGSNLAGVYLDMGEYETALRHTEAAMEMGERLLPKNHPLMGNLQRQLAVGYKASAQWNAAEAAIRTAIQIKTNTLGPGHQEVAVLYQELGSMFWAKGDAAAAQEALEFALERQLPALGTGHPTVAQSRILLGDAALLGGACERAKRWYTAAIAGIRQSPVPVFHREARAILAYVQGLMSCEPALAEWEEAYSWLGEWHELVIQARKSYQREDSRIQQRERDRAGYETALEVCWQLYQKTQDPVYQEQALVFAEHSRASLVWEALQFNKARTFGEVPEVVQQEEAALRQALADLERELVEMDLEEQRDSLAMAEAKTDLLQQQDRYDALLRGLETDYPRYYEVKYASPTIEVAKLQERLPEQASLLEYFWGEEHLYVFVLDAEEISVVQLPAPPDLREAIKTFRQAIYAPFTGESMGEEEDAWISLGQQLYQQLVMPVSGQLRERIVIVPDGSIGYLPFEALLTEPGQSNRFLGQQKRVSYALSGLLYANTKTQVSDYQQAGALAVAPDFTPHLPTASAEPSDLRADFLGPLLFNRPEIEAVQESLGGKTLMGTKAQRSPVLALAPYYQILHLATHAKVHDGSSDLSYLAFSGNQTGEVERLYLSELYRLDLPVEMVVLSACETGVGEILEGEGIASMARGFSYAGAQSVLTSLWSVNDEATMRIMKAFYQELAKGRDKATALQFAKMELMNQPEYQHPFFWASFVLIGNDEPLSTAAGFSYWWLLGLLGLLWLGGWWWRRR
ncbi:MAG: CHAT domain-containing tetratricopeptide repeat protein [Bacteroidota bacterium]